MPKSKTHPQLEELQKRFSGTPKALVLRGYIDASHKGVVRLFPILSLDNCIDIPEDAILHDEKDSESGETLLFVDPSAVISVISTSEIPVMALAMRADDKPDGDTTDPKDDCVQKKQDKCIEEQRILNGKSKDDAKNICEKIKFLHEILCEIGPIGSGGGGTVIV